MTYEDIFERAEELYGKGMNDEAAQLYTRYLEHGTDKRRRSEANIRLGDIVDVASLLDYVIEHYRAATEEDPENAYAHLVYGHALTEGGKSEEGLKHIVTALKLDPSIVDRLEEMLEPLEEAPQTASERVRKMGEESR